MTKNTTPTNEAGHGLPELPEPDFVTPDDNLYTVHTMRRYARDYAAALSLSRGVPELTDEAIERALDTPVGLDHTLRALIRGDTMAVGYAKTHVVRMLINALQAAPAAAGAQGEVLVTVSGLTGSGKSAIAGEIEILCRALGLEVTHDNEEERSLTHGDWQAALELYKPRVRIVEKNIPRTA